MEKNPLLCFNIRCSLYALTPLKGGGPHFNQAEAGKHMGKNRFFNKKFLDQQREKLLVLKQEILNTMRERSDEDIHIPSDQIVEDGDQAQTYINQNVSLGLRSRELAKLKEIEYALYKIENGTYGICEETDGPIEKKRLEKMPWTRLCIDAAEEKERESTHFQTG